MVLSVLARTPGGVSSGYVVDTFSEVVMQNPSEPRVRRSQRDYRLLFKLAVVGEVGRGELSYNRTYARRGKLGKNAFL